LTAFGFKASDGTLDTGCVVVNVFVTSVNHRPVIVPVGDLTTPEDTPISITFSATDQEDIPTFKILSLPPSTVATLRDGSSTGAIITTTPFALSSRTVYFAPITHADVSFDYAATDGSLDSLLATQRVIITAVNHAPVATGQTISTQEDTEKLFQLTGTDDNDLSTSLIIIIDSLPAGVIQSCTTQACTTRNAVTVGTNINTQFFVYTPPLHQSPTTSFQFRVKDSGGLTSAQATVNIIVTHVNHAPEARPGQASYSTDEVTPIVIQLGFFDIDGDTVTVSIPAIDFLGSLFQYDSSTQTVGSAIVTPGTVVTDPSGFVYYVPAPNPTSRSPFTSLTYSVSDGQATAGASIPIFVTHISPPPVAITGPISLPEDSPGFPFALRGADAELPNDVFTVRVVQPPGAGTLYQSDGVTAITAANTVVTDATGIVVFVPGPNEFGDPYTSLVYTVTGTHGVSAPRTVPITVVNDFTDNPVAVFDQNSAHSTEDQFVVFELSGFDPDGQPVTATVRSAPPCININSPDCLGLLYQVGSDNSSRGVQIVGTDTPVTNAFRLVRFEPLPNKNGETTMSYFVVDPTARTSSLLQVHLVVDPVDDAPVANPGGNPRTISIPNTQLLNGFIITLSRADVDNPPSDLSGTFIVLPIQGTLFRLSDGTAIDDTHKTIGPGEDLPVQRK